ncbi:MAG: pseudouridine synthase, partial [Patescibacteria group bacterium]
MKERIQKILSRYGISSRRKAEELILAGRIKINNKIAMLGDKADIDIDSIILNNKKLKIKNENHTYYLVNKPIGYICSVADKYADYLITNLVPKAPKVWPVGRLDKNSTGLMILTNDGELTNKLTHPKFQHEKEYIVEVDKDINKNFINRLKTGIKLKEGIARADNIKIISGKKFNIILHQGWNRQIR